MRIQDVADLIRDGRGTIQKDKLVVDTIPANIGYTYVRKNRHNCKRCFSVAFGILEILPEDALGCWKVIIRCETAKQLLDVGKFLEEKDWYSKYGIDSREFTFGTWKGFIYGGSLEEVKSKQAQLIYAFPDVHTFIQRGCTEINRRFGDSSKWEEKFNNNGLSPAEYDSLISSISLNSPEESDRFPSALRHLVIEEVKKVAHKLGDDSLGIEDDEITKY